MYVTKAASPILTTSLQRQRSIQVDGSSYPQPLWMGYRYHYCNFRAQEPGHSLVSPDSHFSDLVCWVSGQAICLGSRANASQAASTFLKSTRKTAKSLHHGYSNRTTKPTSLMGVGNKLCSYTIASRLTRWKPSHRILGSPSS